MKSRDCIISLRSGNLDKIMLTHDQAVVMQCSARTISVSEHSSWGPVYPVQPSLHLNGNSTSGNNNRSSGIKLEPNRKSENGEHGVKSMSGPT